MKVTFSSSFLEKQCIVLTRMEPGRSYVRGDGLLSGIRRGMVLETLAKNGLVTRTQNRCWFDYKLTPLGESVSANLKSMGI